VVGTLEEALADTVFSAALTARRRELSLPRMQARDAAHGAGRAHAGRRVALVFGNETSGMTNEEAALCSLPVTIPTDAEFSSLNLGAAVQVLAYELRMAALGEAAAPADLAARAGHACRLRGFHGAPRACGDRQRLPRSRQSQAPLAAHATLFNRVRLEREEVALLRGMLTTFETPRRRG
jgi:tRNA/rRNA methyltransferase